MNKKILSVIVILIIVAGIYLFLTIESEKITKGVGEKESSFLIQKINLDSIEGIWYNKYPISTGEGIPKILHLGDDIGYSCEGISEKLTKIDFSNQKITFTKVISEPPFGGCPI